MRDAQHGRKPSPSRMTVKQNESSGSRREGMNHMSDASKTAGPVTIDPVSNVLKWILLAVAVVCFGLFVRATVVTYERAPPQPKALIASNGATVMTGGEILAGKAGFQKADLMDYGSLYGMGSYYGEDYTAWTLIRLAGLVEDNIAKSTRGKPYQELPRAVFEHGLAYARSVAFYNGTLFWQWMRLPGDVVFAVAALLMAWDFLLKLRPIYPRLAERFAIPSVAPPQPGE
jgi:nitric oxide reductase large subunit